MGAAQGMMRQEEKRRKEMVHAKAEEIRNELRRWALQEDLLNLGDQIQFTLVICKLPVVLGYAKVLKRAQRPVPVTTRLSDADWLIILGLNWKREARMLLEQLRASKDKIVYGINSLDRERINQVFWQRQLPFSLRLVREGHRLPPHSKEAKYKLWKTTRD